MTVDAQTMDLYDVIDMHIHTGPDVRPRLLSDVEAARQAAEAGMRAVVFKSHVTCTPDRATIAQEIVPEVRVLGGLTLNDALGGLNPAAAEAALSLGARIVWMPTVSAHNHIVYHGGSPPGIRLLGERGELQPSLFDIFELVKRHDAILATGHVSVEEIRALVPAAREAGVRKVVVTHPEMPWVDLPVRVQEDLRDLGAYFERCFASTLPGIGDVPLARIIADIRRVGLWSTVLATDCGAATIPAPVAAMRSYLAALLAEGFSERDLRLMAGETPAALLRLA
jgi:hypothetical protein